MKKDYIILCNENKKITLMTIFNMFNLKHFDNFYFVSSVYETYCMIDSLANLDKIFLIHFSEILPKDIYEKYYCVNFHIGNLPKGRGGSPIQHLILQERYVTFINALKITDILDGGPILLSTSIKLIGSLTDIWDNIFKAIFNQISILCPTKGDILETTQNDSKATYFKRRKPEESDLSIFLNTKKERYKIYDFIRMLDDDNYPRAFLNFENFKLLFKNAILSKDNKSLKAEVEFILND